MGRDDEADRKQREQWVREANRKHDERVAREQERKRKAEEEDT